MNITLNLDINEVNFILGLLTKSNLPWEQTDPIIKKVKSQGQAQADAYIAANPPAAVEPAANTEAPVETPAA